MSASTLQQLKEALQSEIDQRQRQIGFIDALSDKLATLDLTASFCGNSLDFDHLKHSDVIKVIRALGGKWNKEPEENATVTYRRQFDNFAVRCWRGEPPPNCKLVEVEEIIPEVPAVPERRVKKMKLVCTAEPDPAPMEEPLRKLVLDQ